nr:hypothetical protein [Prosthecochloris marina]
MSETRYRLYARSAWIAAPATVWLSVCHCLGHPEYCPRFGFEQALHYKLKCQWKGVPDEVFMGFIFDNRDA